MIPKVLLEMLSKPHIGTLSGWIVKRSAWISLRISMLQTLIPNPLSIKVLQMIILLIETTTVRESYWFWTSLEGKSFWVNTMSGELGVVWMHYKKLFMFSWLGGGVGWVTRAFCKAS